MSERRALLRQLPAIDRILATPEVTALADRHPHQLLLEAAQMTVEALRRQLLDEKAPLPDLAFESIASEVSVKVEALAQPASSEQFALAERQLYPEWLGVCSGKGVFDLA